MIKSLMSGSWQISKSESDQACSYNYQFTKNTDEGKGWTKTFLLLHGKLILGGGSDGENLPVMQETQVWSQGREDSLEKGTAAHSSILGWTEEPGALQFMGSQRVRHNWATFTFFHLAVFPWEEASIPPQVLSLLHPGKIRLANCWVVKTFYFFLVNNKLGPYHSVGESNIHFQGLVGKII